jgi:hypothetical protein
MFGLMVGHMGEPACEYVVVVAATTNYLETDSGTVIDTDTGNVKIDAQ